MRDDLYQILEAARDDTDVTCITLTGAGERSFCTGADLTEFGTAPSRVIARQVRWERDLWGLILSINKPIIAGLHGYVLGSGMEMAMLCDIRIASDDAVFGMPEAALGMIPVAGGTQILPRTIGIGKTMNLLLTHKNISAQEAKDIGAVNEVVSRKSLWHHVFKVAEQISSHDGLSLETIKGNLRNGLDRPLLEAMNSEYNTALNMIMAKTLY
jgi:enoyl-CoA hydratase/carnithine racemase